MTSKQALGLTMNELAEVNAEHVTTISKLEQKLTELAVQLANAESKCRELAAENAGLKAMCEDRRAFIMNGVQLGYIKVPTVETDPALETIRIAVSPQEPTPATDAFLAEVRAMESKRVYESILDNPAVTDMESLVDWLEQNASDSVAFAAQIRKGAAL